MSNNYSAKDIKVLSDREHVRLRTQVYLGNMHPTEYKVPFFTKNGFEIRSVAFTPAVLKSINEIIDNSWDELLKIQKKGKRITITADPDAGDYTISDNGRGIPIDMHEIGKYTPEVALSMLRAGRNFTDEKEAGVIGQNGVGSACVNYCSEVFDVTIHRDNKQYVQVFSDGADIILPPEITKHVSKETGTTVHFTLDSQVFKNVSLPNELVRNRAIELAFSNPELTVEYNLEEFSFKRGFPELLNPISKQNYRFAGSFGEFFVSFDLYEGLSEQIFTWVNSSLLFDGGICNTQFYNAFVDKVVEHLAPQAKRMKIEVTANDVRRNLLIFGNLRIQDPQYDAQSKTRLTGPNLKKEYVQAVEEGWKGFVRQHKEWLEAVLERAARRHKGKADKEAVDELKKTKKKKVEGLLDATSRDRQKCKLLICEGLSASGQIGEVRDPEFIGAFSLTGKFNNVFGASVADLLKMGKVKDLLAAIGLVPGQKATKYNLNFGEIIIATDADYDGGNIFTMMINLFYQFWPELLDPKTSPIVFRMIAPNVCAVKGNKRVHFPTRNEYEKVAEKYKGWKINYYKGLGSMEKEDWEMLLSGETKTFIPIQDDGMLGPTLELIFGPDSDARKEWLSAGY